MTVQQLRDKLLNLNLANENIATVLLDLGNFESLITIVCSQREALERVRNCSDQSKCISCGVNTGLAVKATDARLKAMGVL